MGYKWRGMTDAGIASYLEGMARLAAEADKFDAMTADEKRAHRADLFRRLGYPEENIQKTFGKKP